MAGSLKKVGIGREDCVYPSDESYPLATWERQGSLGTLTGLTKMPNMWISHKNTINAQYYNSGALTDTTISDACAAIGTTNVRTLYIGPGDWVIEADLDLSSYSNICFEIAPGANLQISNTKTLTINGPFKAGLYQVFSGDGNVKFGGGTVKEVYPEWFGDVDGTADEVQINLAMAAFTNSKGIVRLTKENYTTAATINLGTYIVLKGSGGRNTQITYSGSGSAIAGSQVQHAGVTDLYIQVTHDDGNGIELGDSCRRNHLERLYINNDGDAAVTGAGIYLNNNGATWSGGLNIEDVYVSSFKFGIKWNGASFTSVAAQNVWLVGRSAGVIAGSAGISMDANGDGIGSTFTGGTIESFATGVAIADGANGISIQADFEGNTTPWTLGSSYTGEIAGIGGGTDFERHSSNSTSNKFYVEKQDSGVYTKETYYDQRYVINGSGNRYWGAFTGSTGASYVGGDTVHPSVGFRLTPGGGHTVGADPEQYFMYIKDRRVTFATALPTSDTWAVGSIIWNANINVAGGPSGWVVIRSGTFGAATDNTGDTDGSTAVITGMTDTSDFNLYDYVDVSAGFPSTGPYKIIAKTSTTITLDTNSDSSQSNITVDTSDPTFVRFGRVNGINTLANDATPSVSGVDTALTGGTTTITDFDDGETGQIIRVIAEHSLTITDGTNIFLSGSANWAMTATDTLTLVCKADNKWYELSRGDNGA